MRQSSLSTVARAARAAAHKPPSRRPPIDAEREWAYDRQSAIGRLDKGMEEAKQRGWTVVSIGEDWKRIFPFEKE